MTFFKGFFIVCDLTTIICFLLSLKFSRKNPTLVFINNFRYYLFASVTINTLMYFEDRLNIGLLFLLYLNIEFFCFSYFFYKVLLLRTLRITIKCAILVLLTFQVLFLLRLIGNQQMYGFVTIENILFIYLSLSFFRSISNAEPVQNLINHPTFWIVIGIFFLFSISTPYYATCWYFVNFNSDFALDFSKTHSDITTYLSNIPVFGNFIQNCFFLKAFTCKNEATK